MNGREIVLIHGWGMSPAVWRPLQAELPEFTVIAPPLPGHDGAPVAAAAALECWTDELLPILPDNAIVVGWSLGAMLALDLALRHPHKAAGLVLLGATPRFVAAADWPAALSQATVDAFLAGYGTAPEATLRRFLALQIMGDRAGRKLLPALDGCRQHHPDGSAIPGLVDGLRILADTDLRARSAAVRQPVSLIHGSSDALMPAAAAAWLEQHLPRASLTVLEGCGHALPLSRAIECAALIRGLTDA